MPSGKHNIICRRHYYNIFFANRFRFNIINNNTNNNLIRRRLQCVCCVGLRRLLCDKLISGRRLWPISNSKFNNASLTYLQQTITQLYTMHACNNNILIFRSDIVVYTIRMDITQCTPRVIFIRKMQVLLLLLFFYSRVFCTHMK